jgi:L-threonylcarbamoyladenylate synthase
LRVECDSEGIKKAANAIKSGSVIVFPTDTVYGIGCDPYDIKAVELIYKIKNRDPQKLFPVLGFSQDELEKIAVFTPDMKKIIEKFWPGPITVITKLKDDKIRRSMSLKDKIAVRVPNNECILSLLKECKLLIGTSANISGSESFTDPNDCEKKLDGYDMLIDGGKILSEGESTIIEFDENGYKILRKGSISEEEIQKIL